MTRICSPSHSFKARHAMSISVRDNALQSVIRAVAEITQESGQEPRLPPNRVACNRKESLEIYSFHLCTQ